MNFVDHTMLIIHVLINVVFLIFVLSSAQAYN